MDDGSDDGSIDPDVMARAFAENYCRTFNRNRAALGELYQEGSMLTFLGDKIQGAQAIVAKLASVRLDLAYLKSREKDKSGPARLYERASDGSIDPDVKARAFAEQYCRTFNRDRAALGELYQERSTLTFEGEKIHGARAIVAKLASVPFQLHDIDNVDCLESEPQGTLLVSASGAIQPAGENHKSNFSLVFILMPTHEGNYMVTNHVFRLFSLTAP